MLIPSGVDGSRDSQGFIMNKQRNTSSLNSSSGSPDNVHLVAGDETYDVDGGNFSFSFWIKFRKDLDVFQAVLGNINVNAFYSFIGVKSTYVTLETLTNAEYITGQFTAMTDNNWYHFTLTTAGDGTGIWYKDGVTTGVTLVYDTGSAIQDNVTIGSIGGHDDSSTYDCKSAIDGVLIYNRTLTAAEVLRNYNATKGSHRN
jgi:hypothetical protein